MPDPSIEYEDDCVRIAWYLADEYYQAEWKSVFRKGEPLRRAYQACIEAAFKRPGALWLVDASHFSVLDPADVEWVEQKFWPAFVRAGAVYQACIVPKKEVSKLTARRSLTNLRKSGRFEMSLHTTREEAHAALAEFREKQKLPKS